MSNKILTKKDVSKLSMSNGKVYSNVNGEIIEMEPILIPKKNTFSRKELALEILKKIYPELKGVCINYGDWEMDIVHS